MSDLARQIQSVIAEHQLLSPGESVLVAASGGLDSMVLLHILHELSTAQQWRLAVAHFNHQLRRRASDADERFVRKAASELELPVRVGRADVRTLSKRQGISIEMAARQLRHQFLARTALRLRISKIALAHHASDQVELFFLRLFRGASPEGLAGMRWTSPSPSRPDVQLIRPLLSVFRKDLTAFAAEHEMAYRHDASNDQLDYERNRIRHDLLPLLRSKYQPALDKTVLRLMATLGDESDFVGSKAREAEADLSVGFEKLPVALQRRRLFREALALGLTPDFDMIEDWRRNEDTEIMINPSLVVRRDPAGHLRTRNLMHAAFNSDEVFLELSAKSGRVTFAHVQFAWRIESWPGWGVRLKTAHPGVELFDADKVGNLIRLRHWRPGDRFQPIGMPAAVKVQDLFTNLKIPWSDRRQRVLAETAEGEIFWIEGLRISERFKIDHATTRVLRWSWNRVRVD